MSCQAVFRPLGTSGSERSRTPVALKIAFAIAGARPIIGHSPAPAEGRSLRSSKTVSISGRSLNRGTRYCDILPFRILPFSNSIVSNSAPPKPLTFDPSTWWRRLPGFTTAPHSKAETIRTTRMSRGFRLALNTEPKAPPMNVCHCGLAPQCAVDST